MWGVDHTNQYYAIKSPNVAVEKLYVAVILRAINDLHDKCEEMRESALSWFLEATEESNDYFTFRFLCDALGLERDIILPQILALTKKAVLC